jgi:hypothetical protein
LAEGAQVQPSVFHGSGPSESEFSERHVRARLARGVSAAAAKYHQPVDLEKVNDSADGMSAEVQGTKTMLRGTQSSGDWDFQQ